MIPLDYGTWFVAAALAVIGVPLILVADRLSRRIQSRTGRILMVYPIGGIGFLLLGATAAFKEP